MSKSVDEKIKQSVEQAKIKLAKMKRDFDYSAGETDLKTRGGFDISEIGKAFSIAQKAANETNRIIKEREVTVHTLDITCRALLSQEPSIDSIADIYEIIKELNDFEINFSISTTLNRDEVASGSKDLDASLTAKMIEAFWESTFTNHPDYDDYLKRKKEKEEKERKKQSDEKAQARKKTSDQKSVIAQAQQHYNNFVQQGEHLKAEYNTSLENAMQIIKDKVRTSIEQSVKTIEGEMKSQQNTLASLGLFAFSKKKECQTKIAELESQIGKLKTEDHFTQQIAPYQKAMDSAKTKYADVIAKHISNAFVEKEHPNYEHEEKIKNLGQLEDQYWSKQGDMLVAQNILYALEGQEKGMTEAQLRDEWCCYDYVGSVYSILSKLSRYGYIKGMWIEGEQRYFHYRAKILSKISIPMPNPKFANVSWPTPVEAKDILKWEEK